jgi:hypothetical protein
MKEKQHKAGRPRLEKKIQLSVYLPESDILRLRGHCEATGRVMSRVVARLVQDFLKNIR